MGPKQLRNQVSERSFVGPAARAESVGKRLTLSLGVSIPCKAVHVLPHTHPHPSTLGHPDSSIWFKNMSVPRVFPQLFSQSQVPHTPPTSQVMANGEGARQAWLSG